MCRRKLNIIILFAILLPATLLLAGSAQSAGEHRNTPIDPTAGPSANPLRQMQSVVSPSAVSAPANWPQARAEATLRSSPGMSISDPHVADARPSAN